MRDKKFNLVIICGFLSLFSIIAFPAESSVDRSSRKPKNIILFISDGCGFNHVSAADLYQYGKTASQPYEKFPVMLAMSTYMAGGSYDPNLAWRNFDYLKHGCTDSAAAATAISTGVKTYNNAIGLDTAKKPLLHLTQRAEELGKSTGLVTSVQFSHATPAGFCAHNESRNNYKEIAREMLCYSRIDVIMGCGHPMYDNDSLPISDPFKYDYDYVGGNSTWRDLNAGSVGGDADGDGIPDPWILIESRKQFCDLIADPNPPKRVIGICRSAETLQQKRSGDSHADPFTVPFVSTVPTLEEMTKAALNVLHEDSDGFFLMVEGGAIDWAAHAHQSGRLIEEQIDFNKAVQAVIDWVKQNSSWDQTLVIVTADHETGLLAGPASKPGWPPVWSRLTNNGPGKLPGMEWLGTSHTNSLVPFYAQGFGSQLFKKLADRTDPVYGPFLDNTDIANTIFQLWR